MSGQSSSRVAERSIARLARLQHGVVARWQLLEAGVTVHQIELRLRNGRLHEIHRGVYLVGHTVPPPLAIEQAALLACGDGAALSHRSAAKLWNLLPYPASAPAWVTIPQARRVARSGICIRRAAVPRRDIRQRHGIRPVSPPRTILDLSTLIDLSDLESVVAEADFRGLASQALGLPGGPRRTRSPAEIQMVRLLRAAGMSGYETNARIHGYEVDVLWRSEQVAVEIDGWDAHSGRLAFERDRLKTAELSARGLMALESRGGRSATTRAA
jgi:hypothetical protein